MPEHDEQAISWAPGEGETIKGPQGRPLTFKVRGKQTNGALTAVESTVAPGKGPPLHVHRNEDEVWYALEGTLRFKVDDEVQNAPAGSFVFIARGVPHAFQNVGDAPARILVIFRPAGMERFFDRFGEPPDDASEPEAFRTIGSEVGTDVVGPTLAQSDRL